MQFGRISMTLEDSYYGGATEVTLTVNDSRGEKHSSKKIVPNNDFKSRFRIYVDSLTREFEEYMEKENLG